MNLGKPGIIVRLSNLIIVQVLFIFAAVLLILFSPDREQLAGTRLEQLQENLDHLGAAVAQLLSVDSESGTGGGIDTSLHDLLAASEFLHGASVVSLAADDKVTTDYVFRAGIRGELPLQSSCDGDLINALVRSDSEQEHWSVLHSDHLVYCQRLHLSDSNKRSFLVANSFW